MRFYTGSEQNIFTGLSVSEILAQIPESCIDAIVGFEVNTRNITRHPDPLYQYHCAELNLLNKD